MNGKEGRMLYTYQKLRGRIVEKYGTQERFAEAINISSVALSKKMQCKTMFSQKDINLWCKLLDIPVEQIGDYFFA